MQEQGSMPGQTTPVISPSVSSPAQDIQRDYAYYKAVFAGQPMPFAYLDLDLLARNIGDILKRAQGKKIRLASKSLRSVWVLRHLLAAAPTFQGIMSFSAREAAYLASQGFDDLLIGYPCWHEEDIAAIARPTANGKTITLMIDSIEHVAQLEKVAQRFDVRLPLCLDIDMALQVPGLHFGTWRSPVKTPSSARRIIERILASKYVYLDGLMGYEAQIAGVGDNVPGQAAKNALIQQLKRRSVKEVAERRLALVELIRSYGISLRFVNGGGTGSLSSTSQEEVVTEITVGSGFYSPTLFDLYREFRYQSAAGYAIEIVRRAAPHIYTCLGGGYIASGSAGKEKLPQPYLPEGAKLDPLEGAGEVQTPIHYHGPISLHLGDPIFMRHSKAGELCERFTHLLLVSNGAIVNKVPTYRGDGQCFI
ncbi:MAG TPA: amino acid deaminase/aldolase [Ktedonobacteraceae bacterium]|jgi:D-serine deaminase-like pyridoxal phosphate-dependent protein|nr:amino acid deaminase/aldolase [Ktedonobacteraceae bacterium]